MPRIVESWELDALEPTVLADLIRDITRNIHNRSGIRMARVIDEMPTMTQVENANHYEIVAWHLYLRPTMSNDELAIVKAIAQRYDRMSSDVRQANAALARRRHE